MHEEETRRGLRGEVIAALPDLLFTLAVLALSAWMLTTALQWPWESGLFPGTVAGVMLVLAAAQLVREVLQLLGPEAPRKSTRVVDLTVDEDLPRATVVWRAVALWVWTLGFFASILLIGFVVSVPLFVFLYHVIQGRERVSVALAWALVALVFTIGVFDMVLHTRWLIPLWPAIEDALLDTVHEYLGAGV